MIPIARCAVLALVGVGLGQQQAIDAQELFTPRATYSISDLEAEDFTPAAHSIWDAAWLQPQPLVVPTPVLEPETVLPSQAAARSLSLFGTERVGSVELLARQGAARRPSADVILGTEAEIRVSTDSGNLLSKSPSALGLGVQRRNPVISDPRVRGGRVGRLAASGSYWVPARMDLDTMTSKLDSRLVQDMIVIKGPYSARYGPAFEVLDVQLIPAPRLDGPFQTSGSTSFDYKANGEQIYGRQHIWGGDETQGFRLSYGHRTGNDYRTGAGTSIPSSYNSRDFDLAWGADLTENSSLEVHALRLDQTNVEFPGQAFDIDFLVTDGYDFHYVLRDQERFDRLDVEGWYNRTRFEGTPENLGKEQQFPVYALLRLLGNTDVDSMSTGFRSALTWGEEDWTQLTAGVDFRLIKQELNEITSGGGLGYPSWSEANSPVPRSISANPGIYTELEHSLSAQTTLSAGARGDIATTEVIDDPAKLSSLGIETPQHSLAQILGTSDFDQDFYMWSAFLSATHEIDENWQTSIGFGYAQRPPNLTELYAAQPFMFLLQNGLNTVTGDPNLRPEQLKQIDLGLDYRDDRLRAGVRGFHSWIHDYITFESTRFLPLGDSQQISLQFVNTHLATLAGAEAYGEWDFTDRLAAFGTIQYVDGRDRTRNGAFATRRASGGAAKEQDFGLPRGFYSFLPGAAEEPLPSISPLEGRVGLRLHEPAANPAWMVELSARIVDNQDRVATSLGESPTPGFTVWDVRGTWRPRERLQLIAGIENFTDRAYREHLDFRSNVGNPFLQPGINVYCGGELSY